MQCRLYLICTKFWCFYFLQDIYLWQQCDDILYFIYVVLFQGHETYMPHIYTWCILYSSQCWKLAILCLKVNAMCDASPVIDYTFWIKFYFTSLYMYVCACMCIICVLNLVCSFFYVFCTHLSSSFVLFYYCTCLYTFTH